MEEIDRISNLPDFILHRILSFLLREEAGRCCVLSKRWSCIWDSFPILEFYQYDYVKGDVRSVPDYMDKVREFMNVVDKSLEKFTEKKLRMERLGFHMHYVDHNLVSMVDRWMSLALNNGVQKMTLSVCTDLLVIPKNFYVLPESLFAAKRVNGYSNFNRLQNLSLHWVQISERVIQDIIHKCPNIHHLSLEHICGLRTIKISKLEKLESVGIWVAFPENLIDSVSIDAPKLKCFSFNPGYHTKLPSKISLTSCHDLKEVSLRNCGVTDDWLHLCLSRFPLLENLEIATSPMLRSVRISGQQLKTLNLCRCENIESIQIDAPSLSLFQLTSYTMPVLISENFTGLVDIEYHFSLGYSKVYSSRFLELRKFLGFSHQRKYLMPCLPDNKIEVWPVMQVDIFLILKREIVLFLIISFAIFVFSFSSNLLLVRQLKFNFDTEELGQVAIPPLIKIEQLKIQPYHIKKSVECATLIDGLLWSCHPMTISVPSVYAFHINFIKILCEKLLGHEQSTCCNSSRVKCWRHDFKALKEVRIKSIIGKEDEQLLHPNLLLDALPSLTNDHEVHFDLEWDF